MSVNSGIFNKIISQKKFLSYKEKQKDWNVKQDKNINITFCFYGVTEIS